MNGVQLVKEKVRSIKDFPIEGIIFRDITPVLQNPEAFNYVIAEFVKYAKEVGATKIVGPEARGFLFGAPVACELKLPFIPIRKPGKLPRKQITEEYELEYGKNTLCIHEPQFKRDLPHLQSAVAFLGSWAGY